MATILKQVPTEFKTVEETHAWCNPCGQGMTSDKFVGQPCRNCGEPMVAEVFEREEKIPGFTLIKCPCGKKLECSDFTEECSCGRYYNWAGQELRHPSQWED